MLANLAPRIDTTLAAVFVGLRVVSAAWVTAIAALTLASSTQDPDPAIVTSTIVVGWIWAIVTVVVVRARPQALLEWTWLLPDLAVGAWILAAPLFDGSVEGLNYSGGYPASSLLLWAFVKGLPGGLGAAALYLPIIIASTEYPGEAKVSVPLTYVAMALVVGWGVGMLHRNERRRIEAEAALAAEREARARDHERAEIAARLHDSVLQTLALIQRRAEDGEEVASLARRQERELRTSLFGAPSADNRLVQAVERVASEVETQHSIKVELVTVGDAVLEEPIQALVLASREALVNAAKFSGMETVDWFVEADPHNVTSYVRDRGPGFDADRVPPDRKGVAESIVGRMERHGGHAKIRSSSGGTEVELSVPRAELRP